jgi:hypothetical protein
MNEESTESIKRNCLDKHQDRRLGEWMVAQGDLSKVTACQVAKSAAPIMGFAVTGQNVRLLAEVYEVALFQRVAKKPSPWDLAALEAALFDLHKDHVKLGADLGQRVAALDETVASEGRGLAQLTTIMAAQADRIVTVEAAVNRLEKAAKTHGRMLGILVRELYRIETDGVGVGVSDELRALMPGDVAASDNLFETVPSRTSEESAAL